MNDLNSIEIALLSHAVNEYAGFYGVKVADIHCVNGGSVWYGIIETGFSYRRIFHGYRILDGRELDLDETIGDSRWREDLRDISLKSGMHSFDCEMHKMYSDCKTGTNNREVSDDLKKLLTKYYECFSGNRIEDKIQIAFRRSGL